MSRAAPTRSWLQSTIALAIRGALQSAYFILLVMTLGPTELGRYTAVFALVSILSSLAASGAVSMVLEGVSLRPEERATQMAAGMSRLLLNGAVVVPVAALLLVELPFFGLSLTLALMLTMAEVVAVPCADILSRALQGTGRVTAWNASLPLVPGLRLLSIATFAWLGPGDGPLLPAWILAQSIPLLLLGATLLAVTFREARPSLVRPGADHGWHYALSAFAQRTILDIDKVLMNSILGAQHVGLYSPAQRVTELSMLPIHALLELAARNAYQSGSSDTPPLQTLVRLLRRALPLASISAVATMVAIYCLPLLIGVGFTDSRSFIPALMLLPFTYSLWLTMRTVAFGYRMSSQVVRTEIIGSVIVILGNLLLLDKLGAIAAPLLLGLSQATMSMLLLRKLPTAGTRPSPLS